MMSESQELLDQIVAANKQISDMTTRKSKMVQIKTMLDNYSIQVNKVLVSEDAVYKSLAVGGNRPNKNFTTEKEDIEKVEQNIDKKRTDLSNKLQTEINKLSGQIGQQRRIRENLTKMLNEL